MTVNEPRIGNMVYNDRLKHVEFVGLIQTDGVINVHPSEHYSGVPLTEKRLLELGINRSTSHLNRFELNDFLVDIYDDKFWFYYNNQHSILELKYVHQVQNLYFALKQEDLQTIINPKKS